jgi:aminoglycoside phosphotransferase (APT) family kinase protein
MVVEPHAESEKPRIDTDLVRQLVAAQFPQWAELPVRPVASDGWDNRTFHLGEQMSVRLPSASDYAGQVERERLWLPRLAPVLPLPIPVPLAMGEPGEGYPFHWSVNAWLPGETASTCPVVATDRRFGADLATFLAALRRADAAGGPTPSRANFFRGGPLAIYDGETWQAISALGATIDTDAVGACWEAALGAMWAGPPVWIHGDVAPGNLLVRDGRLSGVIDFGQTAVGDPSCDLAITWTFLQGEGRAAFRAGVQLDPATWARARGWALWKALIVAAALPGANPRDADRALEVIEEVSAEHRTFASG